MAVIMKEEGENSLLLEINKGDRTRMREAMSKWHLRDIQSFWRYSLSLLLAPENNGIWIEKNFSPIKVEPHICLVGKSYEQSDDFHMLLLQKLDDTVKFLPYETYKESIIETIQYDPDVQAEIKSIIRKIQNEKCYRKISYSDMFLIGGLTFLLVTLLFELFSK